MQINEAFFNLRKETGILLSPIGIAWGNVLNSKINVELFDSDEFHASPAGSYLVACVFYCTLFGKRPVGLSGKITYRDRIIVDIPNDITYQLQQFALNAYEFINYEYRLER